MTPHDIPPRTPTPAGSEPRTDLAPELLALLADPVDHTPLLWQDGYLLNPRRGVRYPVVDGIPVLLPGAAVPAPGTGPDHVSSRPWEARAATPSVAARSKERP